MLSIHTAVPKGLPTNGRLQNTPAGLAVMTAASPMPEFQVQRSIEVAKNRAVFWDDGSVLMAVPLEVTVFCAQLRAAYCHR